MKKYINKDTFYSESRFSGSSNELNQSHLLLPSSVTGSTWCCWL